MGITIKCKKTGTAYDMGYGGFSNFRDKVASMCSKEFGEHYAKLTDAIFLTGDVADEFYKKFDAETLRMINEKNVSPKVVDFCLQSDCGGAIRYGACKLIYEKIKDYDDDICYGYAGRKDCTMFRDLKALFKECYDNKSDLIWY